MTDTTTVSDQRARLAERPWLNADLPVAERVELLLAEMTLKEKAGLFFHTLLPLTDLDVANTDHGLPSGRSFVHGMHMNHFNLLGSAQTGREMAAWHNELQRLAASTRLGIPVTMSSDPRHSFGDNPGAAIVAGPFSQWPETMGLAATRDEKLVEEFADIARREYLAVGLRVALHPQIDLATEPRWARQVMTFGEDAELAGRLAAAYIRGFQGSSFGSGSVSTMTKHFPGGGPQKDGEDPHFQYGREQVYPGGRFDLHLEPFEAAFEAGTRQIMPYYGMPMGTEYEEVGFSFNKSIITNLLREKYAFDGVVCTDWCLLNDTEVFGVDFPARAWGVEHLAPIDRMRVAIEAGVDQFGGESCPELLIELVESDRVSEARVDVSVRRLLREKFELGLFDDPFVDEDAADRIIGAAEFHAAGEAAQRASITVLTNRQIRSSWADGDAVAVLPLRGERRIYVEGIAPEVASQYGTVVGSPEDADVGIVRLGAPYDVRGTVFENYFHAGSLDFPSEVIAHVGEIAATVPTIVDVYADRPAILAPIVDVAAAVTVNWGANDAALLDVLIGAAKAKGRLPFDLPRSTAAVEASRPDVPFDTEDPLFRFGHGLELAP